MTKQESKSAIAEDPQKDWTKVLFEIIIKILTLGFYHLERHRSNNGDEAQKKQVNRSPV